MKNDMINGKPGRSLLIFALPLILGNLFQQFYNMADTIIVGQFVGEDALAAVGASYALTTVFIMVAIGGGIGASVLTSQYLGAKRFGDMKTSVSTALISFLVLSIGLSVAGEILSPDILRLLNTPDNIFDDAVLYLKIYFIGLPFLFMYNILTAVFNALGQSKLPLYLLIASSLLNIGLDLYMINVLLLGVGGAAAATVIAQGLAAVTAFVILAIKLRKYTSDKEKVSASDKMRLYDRDMFVKGTKIAIPSIIQQSIVSVGMLLVQSVVNGFGSAVLAGYSAAGRVESVCVVPMIGTGNAVSTFTAQNLGAGKPERVKHGYHAAYGIIIAFAVVICATILLFDDSIIGAFVSRDSAEAFATGMGYIRFTGFFFAFIGFKAITDGVLRGSGDVNVYMIANLVNLSIRVIGANVFAPIIGVAAVWYAVPVGWFTNYVISFLWYRTGRWSRKKLIEG